MLNQELVITETQRDSPKGGHLASAFTPDCLWQITCSPLFPPAHQQASGEHAPCPSLLAAGPTHSWTRSCIPAPPGPRSQEPQHQTRAWEHWDRAARSMRSLGAHGSGGQQINMLQPVGPAPCFMLLPLCSAPHGKERTHPSHTPLVYLFLYFLSPPIRT